MSKESPLVLAINPGSTSTKIALFQHQKKKFSQTLRHDEKVIGQFESISAQYTFRLRAILDFLDECQIQLRDIAAVVGRGGLLEPIEGGTYLVNDEMLQDLREGHQGEHASNLGGILAHELSVRCNAPAFIVDPVVVDELEPIARLSGCPELPRKSIFHALNHKAVARLAAEEMGREYESLNLIVAHMGGGTTVAAHRQGRVIDVNNGLDGEGPFTPERSGTLPAGDLVRLCYSGRYNRNQVLQMIKGKGGIMAYLGTNDMRRVEEMVKGGDTNVRLIYEAMAYQVAKEIGAMSAVLEGLVDAILLTGGVAYDQSFVGWIEKRVRHIAPIMVYPGEEEMDALVRGALRVLEGRESARTYHTHR